MANTAGLNRRSKRKTSALLPFVTFHHSVYVRKVSKALAKRSLKLTQVNASLQNENLRMDLRRVAKRIRKLARKSQKAVNFTHIIG